MNDDLIHKLFIWAETDNEPLQTYATGLLASCMQLTETAANFRFVLFTILINTLVYLFNKIFKLYREKNKMLVPKVLDRLQKLYTLLLEEMRLNTNSSFQNLFANLNDHSNNVDTVKLSKRKRSNFLSYYLSITCHDVFILLN